MTHQLGKFERRNWLPVAQCILPNPALKNPGGLLGGGHDGYVKKNEKGGKWEIPPRAEGLAYENPWRLKETWSFRQKERNSAWLECRG